MKNHSRPALHLTFGDVAEIFFRSFLLQALWSYERMQNLGWVFSLWPALRRLFPEPRVRAKEAVAHAEFFSTHPYMARLALGVVAGLEEDRAREGRIRSEEILAIKRAMSGPLAAIGEMMFWNTLRPTLLVVMAVIGVVFSVQSPGWLALAFLALFNSTQLAMTGTGLYLGYRQRQHITAWLGRWKVQRWIRWALWAGLLCALGGVVWAWLYSGGNLWAWVTLLWVVAGFSFVRRPEPLVMGGLVLAGLAAWGWKS